MNKFYLVLFVLCMTFNNHLMHGMEGEQQQDVLKSFPILGPAIPEASPSLPSNSAETIRQNILNVRNPAFNLVVSDDLTHILQKQQNIENKLGKLMEPTFKQELGHMTRQVSVQVFSQVFSQLLMAGIAKGVQLGLSYFRGQDIEQGENAEIILHKLSIETAFLRRDELKQKILMNQQNLVNQGIEKEIEKLKYLIEEYKRLEKETYDLAKKKELQEKQQDALDKIDKLSLNRTVNKSMQFAANPILAH